MRALIPDPKSLNSQHPVHRRDRATRAIEGHDGVPPLTERHATRPGYVSMYDHVTGIKTQALADLAVTLVRVTE